VHQTYLAAHTSGTDLASHLANAQAMLFKAGAALPDAAHQAQGELYRTLQQQSTALAYIDVTRVMTVCCVLALPLLLIARRARGMAMGH
jgi:hypothetical protein